jgi:hypothetical protein
MVMYGKKKKLDIIDTVIVTHRKKNGEIIRQHTLNTGRLHRILVRLHLAHNSITKYGMAEVSGLILGTTGTAFTYVAIGTGTTADSVNSQTLGTEKKRKTASLSRVSTDQTNDTAEWVATFSSADSLTGTDSIDETGILNASSTGILLLHIAGTTNYGAADSCNWDQGDTLQITIKCQVKQGA